MRTYSREACLALAQPLVEYLDLDVAYPELEDAWTFLGQLREHVPVLAKLEPISSRVASTSFIEGDVHLGPRTTVLPGCYLVGPMFVGEDCVLGPNAYVRPNSFIADGCRIGHAVELVECFVGLDTVIAHLAYAGRSLIGSNAMLGAGVILSSRRLDDAVVQVRGSEKHVYTGFAKFGAIVGPGARIGSNATLMPGQVVPSGSMLLPRSSVD